MKSDINLIEFNTHGDDRGQLIAIEENRDIPFEVKRVYYMFETKKGVVRGKHAHRKLMQVLICISGSCKVLLDDGKNRETVILDRPDKGLLVTNVLWREMYDFSENAVLMVLASELYDESDYIRDYDEFLAYIEKER